MSVKPIPEGFHAVTPYLTLRDAGKVIDFLKSAFDAEFQNDGKIMHAEVKIGDSRVMITEASERAPASVSTLYLYVPDVDRVYQQAIRAGGKSVMEPADMFYGDRSGGVKDASGNSWFVATHKQDFSRDELKKRADAFYKAHEKDQKNKAA